MPYYDLSINGNNCQASESSTKPIAHGSAQQTLDKIHQVMGDTNIQIQGTTLDKLRNRAEYIHRHYQKKITTKVQGWERSYGRIITAFLKAVSGLNSKSKKVNTTFGQIDHLYHELDAQLFYKLNAQISPTLFPNLPNELGVMIASHMPAVDLANAARVNTAGRETANTALANRALGMIKHKVTEEDAEKALNCFKTMHQWANDVFHVVFREPDSSSSYRPISNFMIHHKLISQEMVTPGKTWSHFVFEQALDKFALLSEEEILNFLHLTARSSDDEPAPIAFLCKVSPEKLKRVGKSWLTEILNETNRPWVYRTIVALIRFGMDPNLQVDFNGQTMSLLQRILTTMGGNHCWDPLAIWLLEHGARPENLLPQVLTRHNTLNQNLDLIQAFINAGADRNPPNLAQPLLSYAPDPNVTQLLIENGFPLNARDINGRTAFMYAFEHGNATLANFLLAAGDAAYFESLAIDQAKELKSNASG